MFAFTAFKYTIVTAAVLSAFVDVANAADCTTVTDFETLKSKVTGDKNLRIEPGGFYADATENECFFLSIGQPGLKENFPSLVEDYNSVVKDLTDPNATSDRSRRHWDHLPLLGVGSPAAPAKVVWSHAIAGFSTNSVTPMVISTLTSVPGDL